MLKLFFLVCFTVNVFVDSIPLDEAVIEERILGGNDTDISKFPHQVAIYLYNISISGGFIVSSTHIVAAADSVLPFDEVFTTVRVGSSSNEEGGEVVNVKKITFHPKYNKDTKDYNAAVIELATPLKINNKTIKPIKLATKEPSTGSIVSFSGWGFINEHRDQPDTLQSLTIPVVDRTKCATSYKPKNVTITQRMICAGGEGKTICKGDSGGALVYKDEAVGIGGDFHNYGPWCQRYANLPAVFTNIVDPEIIKFIKDTAKL